MYSSGQPSLPLPLPSEKFWLRIWWRVRNGRDECWLNFRRYVSVPLAPSVVLPVLSTSKECWNFINNFELNSLCRYCFGHCPQYLYCCTVHFEDSLSIVGMQYSVTVHSTVLDTLHGILLDIAHNTVLDTVHSIVMDIAHSIVFAIVHSSVGHCPQYCVGHSPQHCVGHFPQYCVGHCPQYCVRHCPLYCVGHYPKQYI